MLVARFWLLCIAGLMGACSLCQCSSQPVMVASMNYVDYDFPTPADRSAYMSSGAYKNASITGIKVWGEMVFLTVPRWRPGVPATLGRMIHNDSGHTLLSAYPSWDMNTVGDCDKLQYVQSMEVTPDGHMWVIDVGRVNIFDPFAVSNVCPPKLMILDLHKGGKVIDSYVFPADVVSRTDSFLNDIVVDVSNQIAYISEAGTGGIVVFRRKQRDSRYFTHASTLRDPSVSFTIGNTSYGTGSFHTPEDGIALTADGKHLFYCPLQHLHLFSLDATKLRDFDTTSETVAGTVYDHGVRPSPADGLTFDCDGRLYMGGLTTSSVYVWTPQDLKTGSVEHDLHVIKHSEGGLRWVDTFAFGPGPSVWFTSNRLDQYFKYTMHYDGSRGPNFRVWRMPVESAAYMSNDCRFQSAKEEDREMVWVWVVGGCALVACSIILVWLRRLKQQEQQLPERAREAGSHYRVLDGP